MDPDLLPSVQRAWRDLADRSLLCPPGWCGIVTIGPLTIRTAPDGRRRDALEAALSRLTGEEHTDPEVVSGELDVADVLGPAALAYRAEPLLELDRGGIRQTTTDDPAVIELLTACSPRDRGEAAVDDITSPVFVLTHADEPVAVSGYELWPNDLAHLSVLTAPTSRGRGFARRVAAAATDHAVRSGLIAQWRARPVASQRVAHALGFTELGRQLSLDVRRSPVLTDGGVTLRCLRTEDGAAHLAGEDPEQVRWLNEGHHSTPERVAEWIAENAEQWRTDGPRLHLGIFQTATGELAGGVEANLGLLVGAPRVVNVSYAVFPGARGRRFAARAVDLLLQWLRANTPACTAVLRIHRDNAASHQVAASAGFVRTGTMVEDGEPFVRYERELDEDSDA